ncbi:M56 family metallopeptidase [Neolewinella persica]|uniref:M56 family metallopeptidase n=1 Tax=Neolewinella persica TaxID=70998 RepID=UPI0003690077|nr:M56 family metallopeptidase [Neolewinella persica]
MTSLLTENAAIVETLGWTILHSLWQATLLAGLLWLVSRLTRSARTRYTLAYGTLLAQLATSLITFSWLFEVNVAETVYTAVGPLIMTDFRAAEAGPAYWNPGMLLFWIVVFWAVGLLIGTVRLGISFGRVRRMQRSVEVAVPDHFRATIVALARRIGYHGLLHLRISTELGGPALVGHLKPLLLFPIAVVNQLSTEEAEAVILHELAHLKRNDHWWNLLQCLIEVVFYYHPVVWWIGARIREEREHCCDDLVLQHGPNRLAYAKALLYFEHQRATPATAVALTNNPSGLLGRVKRFLHQQNIPYQMKSRLFLLPLLTLIAIVCTAAYNPAEKALDAVADIGETAAEAVSSAINNRSFAPAPAPKKEALNLPALAQDSLPSGRHKVSSYRNGSSTEVIVEDKAIKELTIDGKVIPKSEYDQHEAMVERLLGTSEDQSPMQIRGWSEEWSDEDRAYHLKHLKGLRSLESLRGLESLKSLEGLEGLESLEGLERLDGVFLDMGGDFEELGLRLGEMGEELGRSFEGFFEYQGDGEALRFKLDHDGESYFFNSDSIPKGRAFRFNSDGGIWELDGQVARPNGTRDKASEIEEMETMIERLERRKAEMQRDLERAKSDEDQATRYLEQNTRDRERMRQNEERAIALDREAREHEMHEKNAGPDYQALISQLQREGLLEGDDELSKLAFDSNRLKVNGKTASTAAHQRLLELYEQQTGEAFGKGSSVKVSINN